MTPALEVGAAEFRDHQRIRTNPGRQLDHTVAKIAQIVVGSFLGGFRRHDDVRTLIDEVSHEGEGLAAKLEPVRGEIVQVGDRVDNHAPWFDRFYRVDDRLRSRLALDF